MICRAFCLGRALGSVSKREGLVPSGCRSSVPLGGNGGQRQAVVLP